jgi:hypothetical protein
MSRAKRAECGAQRRYAAFNGVMRQVSGFK